MLVRAYAERAWASTPLPVSDVMRRDPRRVGRSQETRALELERGLDRFGLAGGIMRVVSSAER